MAGFRWTERADFGPEARGGMAMAYDSVRGVTVMFGGAGGGVGVQNFKGDTWEWDGKQWVQVSDMGPAARLSAGMVFAADKKVCVLFGGSTTAKLLGDTWQWDGTAWTELLDSGPPARYQHGMAFDSNRNRVVLFGGDANGGVPLGDTWEFDGESWTEQTATGPSGRSGMSMAYDDVGKRVVLFGGVDAGGKTCADTWRWDGQRWVQIAQFGPTARWSAATSGGRGSVVLMGGIPSVDPTQTPLGDTWQLNGNLWKQLENIGPGPLSGAASVVDTTRGVIVLFGGVLTALQKFGDPGALSGNTWEAPVPASTAPTLEVQSVTVQKSGNNVIVSLTLTGPAPATGVVVNVSVTSGGQTTPVTPQTVPAGLSTFGLEFSLPSGTFVVTAQITGTPAVTSEPITI